MDEQRMTGETGDKNAVLDQKLRQFFDGKMRMAAIAEKDDVAEGQGIQH